MTRVRRPAPISVGIAGKALEFAAQAALVAAVARALGPADYGTFALVLAVVTLTSAATALGGPGLMARFIGGASPQERAGVARALAVRSARFRAGLVAAIALCAIVLTVARPDVFPTALTLLTVLALGVDAAATFVTQLALGLGRPTVWSLRFAVQNATIAIAAPLGYVLGGIEGAVAAIALGAAAPLAWGAAVIRAPLRSAPRHVAFPDGAARFAVLQVVAGVATQVMHRGPIPVLVVLASSTEGGLAAIALGVVLAGTYGIWQMSAVTLPGLAQTLRSSGALQLAEAATRRLAARATTLAIPAALLGVLIAEPLVRALFGAGYRPAARPLAIALASLPMAPHTAAIAQCCALRLRPGLRAITTSAAASISLVIVIVLAPTAGPDAASIALVAGTAVAVASGAFALRDALGWRGPAAGLGAAAATLAAALAVH